MARVIPILMYHQVSPDPIASFRKYVVSPGAFAAQMRWLALAGYRTVGLDAAIGPRLDLPRRPVIITFDDGYRDCAAYVRPVLLKWGFDAVFFLVAGLMGQTSRWLLAERGFELPLIDWATARGLEADGFTCASHSLSHPRLAEISDTECRRELAESRALLEEKLGHEVRDLAYPFGSVNARVRTLAGEIGYRSACSVSIGLSGADDDRLALHRVPVNGQEALIDFIWRLHTTLGRIEWLQERLRGALVRRAEGRI
jgi:peptidoglycan/xylan/chitin deacetylase (PgdA/CDA1 family)